MPTFHVYVEGPVDPSPDATIQLAEVMAQRYGLPASELASRLARGRFRVKANVDRATADAYVRDLGTLGARVAIEPVDAPTSPNAPEPGTYRATGSTSDRITNVRASQSMLIARGATPPAGVARTATPPAGVTRTATPAAGVSQPSRAAPVSGLATGRTATPPVGVSPPSAVSGLAAAHAARSEAGPRATAPSSGLAAAGASASAPARPSQSSGLAAAGAAASSDARPSTSSLPSASAARPSTAPASGLSAAFAGEQPLDLGAIGDGGEMSLAAFDDGRPSTAGRADAFQPPATPSSLRPAETPPDTGPDEGDDLDMGMEDVPRGAGEGGLPASFGPATSPPVHATAKSAPLDRFAPPEAATDIAVDFAIAADDSPPARPSSPPDSGGAAPSTPLLAPAAMRSRDGVSGASTGGAPGAGGLAVVQAGMPRARFAAGVGLALVLGFVPAHVAGHVQEDAYAQIDRKVQQFQTDATFDDTEVDAFRGAQLDAKKRKRTRIAMTSLLVWALAAAALAYVWFRRIPWERIDARRLG